MEIGTLAEIFAVAYAHVDEIECLGTRKAVTNAALTIHKAVEHRLEMEQAWEIAAGRFNDEYPERELTEGIVERIVALHDECYDMGRSELELWNNAFDHAMSEIDGAPRDPAQAPIEDGFPPE